MFTDFLLPMVFSIIFQLLKTLITKPDQKATLRSVLLKLFGKIAEAYPADKDFAAICDAYLSYGDLFKYTKPDKIDNDAPEAADYKDKIPRGI